MAPVWRVIRWRWESFVVAMGAANFLLKDQLGIASVTHAPSLIRARALIATLAASLVPKPWRPIISKSASLRLPRVPVAKWTPGV